MKVFETTEIGQPVVGDNRDLRDAVKAPDRRQVGDERIALEQIGPTDIANAGDAIERGELAVPRDHDVAGDGDEGRGVCRAR